nr:hypothetical protein [Paraflavitalea speifideiaquila]
MLNIESNATKVEEKDVTAGNIVTFHFSTGYPYHTGMVTDVSKDKDGNVTSFTMIHSSGGVGPNKKKSPWGREIRGRSKWFL